MLVFYCLGNYIVLILVVLFVLYFYTVLIVLKIYLDNLMCFWFLLYTELNSFLHVNFLIHLSM